MTVKIIVTILVSAIIGLVTNYLAIKMLFHPYHEHKLFGKIRIPFTPGIIPKNRYRMSKSIAETLGGEILNKDVLEKNVFNNLNFDDLSNNLSDENIKKLLEEKIGEDEYRKGVSELSNKLAKYILNLFREKGYAKTISSGVYSYFSAKLGFLANMLGALDVLIEEKINQYVDENGENKLMEVLEDAIDEFLNHNLEYFVSEGGSFASSIVKSVLSRVMGEIFRKVDFQKIIEEEINLLDIRSFEKMLLKVISKELRAITYFGGLLGGILGIINVLFIYLPNF